MALVFPSRVASNMLRVLTAFWLLATLLFANPAHAVEPFVIKDGRKG